MWYLHNTRTAPTLFASSTPTPLPLSSLPRHLLIQRELQRFWNARGSFCRSDPIMSVGGGGGNRSNANVSKSRLNVRGIGMSVQRTESTVQRVLYRALYGIM